jgi:Uma2 family endonuclease
MSQQTSNLPLLGTIAGFRRFSVDEYHRLTQIGMLTEDDNLELIEGYLVHKMARNPPHDSTLNRANKRLAKLLPVGWEIRILCAVTLIDSEPEPDVAVVREDPVEYAIRHPNATDVGLLIEVSDSTLAGDRADKGRIYARAGIALYWIVNLVDRQIEVYTSPSGQTAVPGYGQRQDYQVGDVISLELDGKIIGTIAVQDILT